MRLAASLTHVLSSQQLLGEIFYRHLFEQVPEAKPFFDGIDMRRQAHLVTMALTVIQQNYDSQFPVTRSFLHFLGTRHHDRGVPLFLYPKWRDAMLGTLAIFHGTDWNEETAGHWKDAIDAAIAEMTRGYTERFQL